MGKIPVKIHMLKSLVTGAAVLGAVAFNIVSEKLSGQWILKRGREEGSEGEGRGERREGGSEGGREGGEGE